MQGRDNPTLQRVQRVRDVARTRDDPLRTSGAVPARFAGRLFVFARHAESTANVARVISSDPARAVTLTERGREQARQLGAQLAGLGIDLAVATRLGRTRETVELALAGQRVPLLIEPGLDEIRAGDCDGAPVERYWAWEEHHTSSERFPHGESMDEALLRYARALRYLLSRTERVTLVVLHEFALRRIAQEASALSLVSDAAFGNAIPYLFHERAVARAATGLEAMARTAKPELPARRATSR